MFVTLYKRWIWVNICLILFVTDCHCLFGPEAVRRFFAYFENDPPTGIPILNAKEPLDLYYPILATPITITDGKLYGHSNLYIDTFFVDFIRFEGELSCIAPVLNFTGIYEWSGPFTYNNGSIECMATQVQLNLNFTMRMTEKDVLEIVDIEQKVYREDLELHMTDLTWVQQAVFNTGVLHLFYQQIATEMLRQNKPFLLDLLNNELEVFAYSLPIIYETTRDKRVQYPFQLESKSSEKRSLVLLVRRIFQYAGLEPFYPPDTRTSIIGVKVHLKNIKLTGISDINDIKIFRLVYSDRKIYVDVKISFPHIQTTFKKEIQFIFFKEGSNDLVNLHGVQMILKLVLDPSVDLPIIKSEFDFQTEWIGNLERYGRTGKFDSFMNKVEKVMQKQLVKVLKAALEPKIKDMLRKINLQESLLQFLEDQ